MITARFQIAQIFLGEAADGNAPTIELVANLLFVGAILFIADSLESIAFGALRGPKDTRIPLLSALIAYWLIAFSLSYVLGLTTDTAIGIWIGASIGTVALAVLLVLRFRLLASKLAF